MSLLVRSGDEACLPTRQAISIVYEMNNYYVYMMTNKNNTVIYTGVTNNLVRRVYEHKNKLLPGFTSKYNITKLVYFETTTDANAAIEREKQIKAGSRKKKEELINNFNKDWTDLSDTI